MEWLARIWQWLQDWPFNISRALERDMAANMAKQPAYEPPPFNWLADYGPHWQPGSTAFWLEPRKEADLILWLRKYRPEFVGEFEAAGLTVTVAERPALEAWRPGLLNAYANDPRYFQSGAYLQAQMQLQQMRANQTYGAYMNALGQMQRKQDQSQLWSSIIGGMGFP